MSAGEEEAVDWRSQYEDLEKQLQDLKEEFDTVKEENEELNQKCQDLQKENKKLWNKINEEKSRVQEVNQLIEPALQEYTRLQSKYEIEKGCRHEAEIYASQMVRQNKKLKRQSMDLIGLLNKSSMPLHVMDINIEEDEKEEKQLENGYQEKLNDTIRELKNEVANLTASLTQVSEDLQLEKENHRLTKEKLKNTVELLKQSEQSLKQHKDAMKELSSVSEAAYREYEGLQKKLELEVKRRSVFEKRIAEVAVENNKMKRQSEVLLMKLTPGDQLHKALMEIEDLTEKLEQQRKYYDGEIAKLESKVEDNSSHNEELSSMEGEKQSLEMEKQSLESEKTHLEKQVQEVNNKYSRLLEQYDELSKKLEEAQRPPAPPPPPPPPTTHTSKGFLSRIIRRKKSDKDSKSKVGGTPAVSEDFDKALEEMMDNIKRGKTLRPTLKPIRRDINEPGEGDFRMVLKSRSYDDFSKQKESGSESSDSQNTGSAMSELHKIMNKMKRDRSGSEGDLLAPIEREEEESELARTFRRIKKTPSVDLDNSGRRDKLSIVSEERDSQVLELETSGDY